MLAEQEGFIVVAPHLYSVQGILPRHPGLWFSDLARDERTILALIDEVANRYNIDRSCILLTGFSAGGFPLWYTGLRNPDQFQMLVARACNSDLDLFESVEVTPEARRMPIYLFWGKDDLQPLQSQCWQAYRWLREHDYDETEMREVDGGHLRRPEMAYEEWEQYLPAAYVNRRPPPEAALPRD
jgi:predicted esterase